MTTHELAKRLLAEPDMQLDVRVEDTANPDHPWFGRNLPVIGVRNDDGCSITVIAQVNSISVG
jgi:hypothetical protein